RLGWTALAVLLVGSAVDVQAGLSTRSGDKDRVAAVSRAFLSVTGPPTCKYLSAHRLSAYGAPGEKDGTVAACENALQYTDPDQGPTGANRVLKLAFVVVNGRTAIAHFLGRRSLSYELDLVREHGAWKIERSGDEIREDERLTGKRWSTTEYQLIDAF